MNYYPDGWCIVRIEGSDPHYRVFASWSGSYLEGESWKFNSGIVECIYHPENDEYCFIGQSGSRYICKKIDYNRISAYNIGVLHHYKSKTPMIVLEEQDWEKIDYER